MHKGKNHRIQLAIQRNFSSAAAAVSHVIAISQGKMRRGIGIKPHLHPKAN